MGDGIATINLESDEKTEEEEDVTKYTRASVELLAARAVMTKQSPANGAFVAVGNMVDIMERRANGGRRHVCDVAYARKSFRIQCIIKYRRVTGHFHHRHHHEHKHTSSEWDATTTQWLFIGTIREAAASLMQMV
jgi:hypothetical protein